MVAIVLVVSSCGSDAPPTLSADDLSSKANSICKKATKAIEKLDPSDPNASLETAIGLFATASTDLAALAPGKAEQADFDDFTSSISKQVKQAKKVATALKDGGAAAATGAVEKMTALTSDSDTLADDLVATKCVGLGQSVMAAAGLASTGSTGSTTSTTLPAETVPTTAVPSTTVVPLTLPPTLPPATLPPATLPPATLPPATLPPDTAPVGTAVILNVMDDWAPPTGYEFQRESGDIMTKVFNSPDADPVLGPSFVSYAVGIALTPGTTQGTIVFVLELADTFTDAQISAFVSFNQADAGSVVDSPGGHKLWVLPASGDVTWDTTMAFLSKYGVVLRTQPGDDAVKIMDSFIANNFG